MSKKTSKLVWKIGDKPTGSYRTFAKRAWPSATWGRDGETAAALIPAVKDFGGYFPSVAESTMLIIRVADHRTTPWEWKQLRARPIGVRAAKEIAEKFFNENPDWLPKTS